MLNQKTTVSIVLLAPIALELIPVKSRDLARPVTGVLKEAHNKIRMTSKLVTTLRPKQLCSCLVFMDLSLLQPMPKSVLTVQLASTVKAALSLMEWPVLWASIVLWALSLRNSVLFQLFKLLPPGLRVQIVQAVQQESGVDSQD